MRLWNTAEPTISCWRPTALGVGKIFEVPEMKALAESTRSPSRRSVSAGACSADTFPAEVRYAFQNPENTQVFDFELDSSDVQLIADLKGCGLLLRPRYHNVLTGPAECRRSLRGNLPAGRFPCFIFRRPARPGHGPSSRLGPSSGSCL